MRASIAVLMPSGSVANLHELRNKRVQCVGKPCQRRDKASVGQGKTDNRELPAERRKSEEFE
jgi:hypothetical protein